MEGISDGSKDGISDGSIDGISDGSIDGISEGCNDGISEGCSDGMSEGGADGALIMMGGRARTDVGELETRAAGGAMEGKSEGRSDGISDGSSDGMSEGSSDGTSEGSSDGISEGGIDDDNTTSLSSSSSAPSSQPANTSLGSVNEGSSPQISAKNDDMASIMPVCKARAGALASSSACSSGGLTTEPLSSPFGPAVAAAAAGTKQVTKRRAKSFMVIRSYGINTRVTHETNMPCPSTKSDTKSNKVGVLARSRRQSTTRRFFFCHPLSVESEKISK